VDFKHLFRLDQRGIFWVARAKENMQHEVMGQQAAAHASSRVTGEVLSDVFSLFMIFLLKNITSTKKGGAENAFHTLSFSLKTPFLGSYGMTVENFLNFLIEWRNLRVYIPLKRYNS